VSVAPWCRRQASQVARCESALGEVLDRRDGALTLAAIG
jgi:hypothetical protein